MCNNDSFSLMCFMKTLLDEELPKLPRLHNLKTLSLNAWCMDCHSGPVAWFLEHSPNLEKLTLWMNKRHCLAKSKKRRDRVGNDNSNLSQIEAAQCRTLKEVEIRLSIGYKKAHGSRVSFLRQAKALENAEFNVMICNWVRVWCIAESKKFRNSLFYDSVFFIVLVWYAWLFVFL